MMTTATTTRTDEVLAGMMTENTGRHMLDSGGAYGRNWERNQGRDVADFVNSPAAVWSDGGMGPVLNVFHFLRDRLEYAPELDEAFHAWCEEPDNERTPWLALAEQWAEERDTDAHSYNSYNGEDRLSQVIQWVDFMWDDEHYTLLQIHGGCDVRGGYTAPRVFRSAEGWHYQLADADVFCTGQDCDGSWSLMGGDVCDNRSGTSTDELDPAFYCPEDRDREDKCPRCGEPLDAGAPYYSE